MTPATLTALAADRDDWVRIAELALYAADNRDAKDWRLMHIDISEAASIARRLLPNHIAAQRKPEPVKGEPVAVQGRLRALWLVLTGHAVAIQKEVS